MAKKMMSLGSMNRDHASRNRGSGASGGSMSQPAGGSTKVHDPGPMGKSPRVTNADVKALKRVAGGRPDTARGRNVS